MNLVVKTIMQQLMLTIYNIDSTVSYQMSETLQCETIYEISS